MHVLAAYRGENISVHVCVCVCDVRVLEAVPFTAASPSSGLLTAMSSSGRPTAAS